MIIDKQLKEAVEEAKRFIAKAELLQEVRKKPPHRTSYGEYPVPEVVEHAACLRASMDLTRSLAVMRKGDRS